MENIRISRFLLVVFAVLAALAFWGTLGLWQGADADRIGWLWDDDNVLPIATSVNNPYPQQNRKAVEDYDTNTDLSVRWCNSPCSSFNIRFIGDGWGETGWIAKTNPIRDRVLCLVNGRLSPLRCNETNRKINSATINWNSQYYPHPGIFAHFVARHELGHVFGLAHLNCGSGPSVMVRPCSLSPDTLQPRDIRDINSMY